MSGFAQEMSEWDSLYAEAETKSGGGGTGLPMFTEGSHQAVVSQSVCEEGNRGWAMILTWTGTDVNTRQPAAIRKWYNTPRNEESLGYFKRDMQMLGYDGLPSELEQACKDEVFIGLLCDIRVKVKPGNDRDFTDVYLNRVHGRVDDSGMPPGAEFPTDDGRAVDVDDIPF